MLEVPGDEENKYDAILKGERDPARDALTMSRRASYGMDSSKAREVLKFNAQTGLPPSHLERALDPAYKDSLQDGLSENKYDAILKNAPSTAKWASDPFRLKAGQEDLDRLARIEGMLRARNLPKPPSDKDFEAQARTLVQSKADQEWAAVQRARTTPTWHPFGYKGYTNNFDQLYAQTREDVVNRLVAEEIPRLKNESAFSRGEEDQLSLWARLGTALSMGLRHGARVNELGRLGSKVQGGDRGAEVMASIEAVEKDLSTAPHGGSFAANWLYTPAKLLGQMADAMGAATKRGYQGAAAGGAAAIVGGQLGPQIAVPEEIVTVPAAALTGGIAAFTAGLAEQAFIVEAGNAYLEQDKIRGKNGEQIPEGVKQASAASVGLINAGLEVVGLSFMAAPAKALAKKFISEGAKDAIEKPTVKAALATFAKEYGKAVAGETSTEIIQEVVGVLGEEVAKMSTKGDFEKFSNSPDARAQVYERLLTVAAETLRGTIVLGGLGSGARLASDISKAKDQKARDSAKEFYEQLKAIEKEVTESELAKENLNEIEAIAADTKSEPTWLPALAAAEYYAQKGLDPAQEIAAITGDDKAFEEAYGRQGDIAIPAEKYISISQGEHKAFFQENLRRAPDEMNMAETKAAVAEQKAVEKAQADAEKAIQQTEEQKAQIKQALESVQRIEETVVQALEAGGFKAEAKRLGIVAKQLFKRLGERTGKDPLEIFNRYGLQIQRKGEGSAAEGATMNQPAFHGSPHKFEKFTTQKIGTGEGAQAYGWGMYFAGNKEVAQFYRDKLSKKQGTDGRLYTVDVPEDDQYLDWDKELADQPQAVKDALLKMSPKLRDEIVNHFEEDGEDLRDGLTEAYEVRGKDLYSFIKKLAEEGLPTGIEHTNPAADPNITDAKEVASKYLHSLGIPGIKFLDNRSRRVGEGTSNYVIFDDSHVKTTAYEQPSEGGGARGRIVIGNSSISIDLFEKADKSTFLHEIGHFYLEVIQDLVSQPNADATLVADMQAIRDWMGLKEGEAITEKHHEKFARAFELYLQEGKAPSKALRKAFYQFRRWLIDIYKEVKGYFTGIELTPQIKGVLDRMLASEEEIFAVRMEQGGSVFDGPAGDILTPEQRIRLDAAQQEAIQEAEEILTVSMMKEVTREEEADWKAEKAKLKAEALADLQKQPVYRALHALTTKDVGGVEGSPEWTGKLQKDAVDAVFTALPRGITADQGAHPDVVADWFGFKDGYDLLYALSSAEDIDVVAERQADERMAALYPKMTSEELRAKAIEAVHGKKGKALRALEMELLAESAAGKKAVRDLAFYKPRIEAIQEEAERDIENVKVGELRPHAYRAAEIRAAKECLKLAQKGDLPGALDAKLREIMNAERYAAAVAARDGVKDFIAETRKMSRSDERLSKTRDIDLVNAARAVLAKWGVGRFKGEPSDFLGQVKSNDPAAYEAIMADVTEAIRDARPYKEATYGEFARMNEAVEALWSVAKSTREMEVEGKKIDAETAREALGADMDKIPANYANYGRRGKESLWKRFKVGALTLKAGLRRVESWADAMGPAFTKYIWNPINDAIVAYRNQRIETLKKYKAAVMANPDIFKKQRIEASELNGYVFESKAHLLGALLHTGNSSNLMKLIVGHKWGEYDPDTETVDTTKWDAFLKRMHDEKIIGKSDYEFAQAVWDLNESIKPLAQKAHKEMYGRYFSEITAEPVVTPWGTFKGGYVPAVVDPEVSDDNADRKAREKDAGFNAEYAMPMTTKGFTMARSKGYAEALTMDLRMIPKHIDEVLRFAYIQPRVSEVKRLLTHKDVAGQLVGIDKKALHGMLIPWLDRAVKQRAEATGWFPIVDRFWRAVRRNVGMQLMVGNVTNAAQNLTGLSVALTKVKAHHLRNATIEWMRSPKAFAEFVLESSDYMRQTIESESSDLIDDINDVITNPNAFQKLQAASRKHGQILQRLTQNPVSLITWTGAYEQAMERLDGNGEDTIAQAVREADAAVRLTQGAQGPENIARFEAGTPFMRAFTQFTGYFNNKANLQATEFDKTIRELGLKKGAGRLFATFFFAHMAPAIIGFAILKTLAGTWDDEDDDGYMDEVLSALFGSQFREATGYFPFVGNVVNLTLESFGGGSNYNDRVMNSPAISMIERAVKVPGAVYDSIEGDLKKKTVQDVLMLLGLLSGTPTGALGRPAGYLMDVEEGKAEPSGPIDFMRGVLTGKRGE